MTNEVQSGIDSAGCERTDPGSAERLAQDRRRYAWRLRQWASFGTQKEEFLSQGKIAEAACLQRLQLKAWEQAEALREGLRGGQGVHGEDPQAAEVTMQAAMLELVVIIQQGERGGR